MPYFFLCVRERTNEKIILTLGVFEEKKNEALEFVRIAIHLMNEIGSLLKAR